MSLSFINWERRPALLDAGKGVAWFIKSPGLDWEKADAWEVMDSGGVVKSEARFHELFRDLPDFPDEAKALMSDGKASE